ncbi:MAG: NAD-dependent epimerase/dehydratase family protein [Parcubacteria group bacterium]|nr:NAD-dependent epimerase/dehydratase family protein [Parcubacteria group bacterium]
MKIDNKKAVVTGGAGFIGSHLVDALIEHGYEVSVIDNLSGGKKENVNPQAILHVADICDYEAIAPIIAGAQYVFHLAALPRVQYSIDFPQETNKVNIGGTVNVLKAAQEGMVKRLVYSASSSCYGDTDIMPTPETAPINPKSPYGLQKYVGEQYARMWHSVYGLSTVALRYFNVFGTRQDPNGAYAQVVCKFFKQKKDGRPLTITGDGEQTRDFVHVSDVARLNIMAAEHEKDISGEFFNVGGGRNFSVNAIADMVGGKKEYISARIESRNTLADITKVTQTLGWTPLVSFEDGIEELRKEFGA